MFLAASHERLVQPSMCDQRALRGLGEAFEYVVGLGLGVFQIEDLEIVVTHRIP